MDNWDEAISSDEDLHSDDDPFDGCELDVPVQNLDTVKKTRTIHLTNSSTYIAGWGPDEAFRELVQNWRDGIIKSFKIQEDEFNVIREERARGRNIEIVLKVLRPNSEPKEWLGFIRFKGRDGMGSIEITNRNATLQPWHLHMGGTSKAYDDAQAGAHGEGLKLALLILQRDPQNYFLQCICGGFKWNFNFTTVGSLVVRLHRMSPREIERATKVSTRSSTQGLAPFASSPTQDVQFIIGKKASGRNQSGKKVRRNQVSLDSFNTWCTVAIFLQDIQPDPEKQVAQVNSNSGDLLVNHDFRGNLYLKGFLLCDSSMTGLPLKYGYNFRHGTVNRDRQCMISSKHEGRNILAIWELVLRRRPLFVADLSDMLNSTEPRYADVAMAKDAIKEETAGRLTEYLFEDKSKWYYSASEREQNYLLESVIETLGRDGVQLTDTYWEILKKYTPNLRTAAQEQRRLFLSASTMAIPSVNFSQEIDWMMKACLRACPQTAQTTIEFVKAGKLLIQTLFLTDQNAVKVHERWLDPIQAVHELGLRTTLNEYDALFHSTRYLFHDILDQIPAEDFLSENATRTKAWHRRREMFMAEQSIMDYLRMKKYIDHFIHLHQRDILEEYDVEVLKKAIESNTEYRIQLHQRSTCTHMKSCVFSLEILSSLDCYWTTTDEPGPRCHEVGSHMDGSEISRESDGYFVVAFNPSDPNAMILSADVPRVIKREAPTEESSTDQSLRTTGNNGLDIEMISSRSTTTQATSHAPVKTAGLSTSPSTPGLFLREDSPSSPQDVSTENSLDTDIDMDVESEKSASAHYTIGHRLDSLDPSIARRWYAAEGRQDGAVVIGISHSGDQVQEPSRKRRRAFGEELDD